jgi:hypothetical protein
MQHKSFKILLTLVVTFLIGSVPVQAQLILPGAQAPAQTGAPQAPPQVAPVPASDKRAAPPPPPKAASVESVIDRPLKLNGSDGVIRIVHGAKTGTQPRDKDISVVAYVQLQGRSISQPGETCTINLGGETAIALTPQGKGSGVTRYTLAAPVCPISFDLVDGAILVTQPAQACQFANADCQIEARGLWGPEPQNLIPNGKQYEQARGKADSSVRESYKQLLAKAGPGQMRSIVSEQANFSSERETVCRRYASEDRHGFCHLKFTEARAVAVRARAADSAKPAAAR